MSVRIFFYKLNILVITIIFLAGCDLLISSMFKASPPFGPLHKAAETGDTKTIGEWISKKKDVNVEYDDTGRGMEGNLSRIRSLTPLMVASENGHLDAVKMLIEGGGASIYAESHTADKSSYLNAFDYAIDNGHLDVAKYLWDKSDKKHFTSNLSKQLSYSCGHFCENRYGENESNNIPLFLASIIKDTKALGVAIGNVACYGSPLDGDYLRRLKFLSEHGVIFPKNTLHCITSYEATNYYINDSKNRIEITQYLLDHGADPNDLDTDFGATPLMRSVGAKDAAMIAFLIAHGADPNALTKEGMTAISYAVLSCPNGHGYTHLAAENIGHYEIAQKNQLEIVELLINLGATHVLPSRNDRDADFRWCCSQEPHTKSQEKLCHIFGISTEPVKNIDLPLP